METKQDLIENFLNRKMLTAPSTRKCYRVNIQNYFRELNKDMNHYFNNGNTIEDYENDLLSVYTKIHKAGKPDLSIRTYFNAVKQFMITSDKRLKDLEFWENLKGRTRGAEPDSEEAILNAKDIKTILSHGNACSRSLYTMLCSSGRRISEILALTPDDVNTKVSPTTINIRKGLDRKTTKTKQKTLCFISDEATESYKTWMKERDEYLRIALNRGNHKKDANDPRIFPMSYHNALIIWRNLLIKGNLVKWEHYEDKYTGKQNKRITRNHKGERTLQHPHCLRKFYRSYLGDADLAEYLMGHGTMLTRAYRQMKPEDLAAKYSKLMQNVTIFSHIPKDIEELKQKDVEKDEQIKDLQKQLSDLNRFLGLKDQLEKVIEEKVNGKKKKN